MRLKPTGHGQSLQGTRPTNKVKEVWLLSWSWSSWPHRVRKERLSAAVDGLKDFLVHSAQRRLPLLPLPSMLLRRLPPGKCLEAEADKGEAAGHHQLQAREHKCLNARVSPCDKYLKVRIPCDKYPEVLPKEVQWLKLRSWCSRADVLRLMVFHVWAIW